MIDTKGCYPINDGVILGKLSSRKREEREEKFILQRIDQRLARDDTKQFAIIHDRD
jgi:hypothetical protein